MKIRITLALGTALGFMLPQMSRAQDHQYLLRWAGTSYTTSANGTIVAKRFSEKDLIQKVATDNGLDPNTLAFVYRVEARDTVVANKANGGFVADVIQLEYTYTDVATASGTRAVRQADLNDENHTNAIGSAFGVETSRQDSQGNLISYSFHGSFNYSYPELGTIYQGSFSTGKALPNTSGQ